MRFVHLSNARLFSENKTNKFNIDFAAERLEAFKKVLKLCRETVVEALFLTGNVFGHEPTMNDVEALDGMLRDAPETRVFILTGEQDSVAEDSALALHAWQSNTQVFVGDCIQRVYVQKYGLEVTGIGYSEKTWPQLSLDKLSRGRKGKYQVLLLPTLKDKGTEDEIRSAKLPFDYVGIGGSQVIAGELGPRVYAPGDFASQDFSNQIEHGYYLGDISEGKDKEATIRFVPADCREFIALQIRLDENSTIEKVTDDVKNIIRKYGEKNMYHVTLTGEGKPEFFFQKKAIFEIGNVVAVNDEMHREMAIDRLAKAHETDAIGRFLKEMRSGENSTARDLALDYGIEALLQARKEATTC